MPKGWSGRPRRRRPPTTSSRSPRSITSRTPTGWRRRAMPDNHAAAMPDALIGLPTGIEVAEQFANARQQRHAAEMGMWAWLLTELLLFGGLFLGALVLQHLYPQSVRLAA